MHPAPRSDRMPFAELSGLAGVLTGPEAWVAVAVLAVAWLLAGAATACLVAIRRVAPLPAGARSVLRGPLLTVWALRIVLDAGRSVVVAPGTPGDGEVDIVVTTPDDPTQVAMLDAVLALWGPELRTVTLTRPAAAGPEVAARELSTGALFLSTVEPRLVVLPDASPSCLGRYVRGQGVELVIVLDDPATLAALRRDVAGHRVAVVGTTPALPR